MSFDDLVAETRAGRCVAFIGAGFTSPVCRRWSELLSHIAADAPDAGVRDQVDALLQRREYEIAAQVLEDAFAHDDTAKLLELVRRHTPKPSPTPEERAAMERRKQLLKEIPFAAILTTNFDEELPGSVLDRETYSALVRDADRSLLARRFWIRPEHDQGRSPILKLHGDLRGDKGITLSRRGYRTRLYSEPGYLNVLRTVFMTKTLLFIGFSFNDAYLNELRSEALAYIGKGADTPTVAYAVLADVHPSVQSHYAKHEGIHVFHYDSKDNTDHGYVDDFLARFHAQTSPAKVMGPRLEGRRILWVDPNDHHNWRGAAYLHDAARGLCTIDLAKSPESALERLETSEYDLVISRWGHQHAGPSDAIRLLEGMRRADRRAPVVVFSSGAFARENREVALRLGALEYTSHWETLFEVIDRRFGPPPLAKRV
jgi:hypothetical protein